MGADTVRGGIKQLRRIHLGCRLDAETKSLKAAVKEASPWRRVLEEADVPALSVGYRENLHRLVTLISTISSITQKCRSSASHQHRR